MALSYMAEERRAWYEPLWPADSISSEALRARWSQSTQLATVVEKAIRGERPLQDVAPSVSLRIGNRVVSLVDLRGFSFQGKRFGKVDLSYCCLDFCDLREVVFEETSLQFSTFRYALLDNAQWRKVQGSPVSLRNASMCQAFVSDCFMMNSDLNAVDLSGSQFSNTSLAHSDLREALLADASFERVDLRRALLTDSQAVRSWYSEQGMDERDPFFIESDAASSVSRDAVVMIVDDSATAREALTHQLQSEGYRVVVANDGVDAIKKLSDAIPSLLLMDIEMPNMNGIEVLRRLRHQVRTSALPVIMITAKLDKDLRREAIDAGVTDYFTKPFNSDFITKVRELAPMRRRNLA